MMPDKSKFYPDTKLTGISQDEADRIVEAVRANEELWTALIEKQKMPNANDEGVWLHLYGQFMSATFPQHEQWAADIQPLIAYTLWSEKDLNRLRFSPELFASMYREPRPPIKQMKFGQ